MNYQYLLALLAFPLVWPWIAKRIWHHTINWAEMGLHITIPVVLISALVLVGRYGQTSDTEIWNGAVLSKHRDHGHYVRTYQCNCYQSCSGSGSSRSCTTICQTCYEDRYTVDWYLKSTVGEIGINKLDRASRSVYSAPDPVLYKQAYQGEPCSREMSYTNYIRAVPDSIFNFGKGSTLETFQELIPTYPRVHNIYHINRVLTPGVNVADKERFNDRLNEALRTIGPTQQANIIVVIVNTADQTYRHALEEAWLGGKKNDIITIIGAPNYPKIAWVDTITLGSNMGNSLMTVTMRDRLMKVGTLSDVVVVADTITDTVMNLFDRTPMAEFEYLKDEIKPPLWVVVIALILGIGGSLGLTVLFHREDFFPTSHGYRRFR